MRRQTEIYSIFGQIEGVVADLMVQEGKARKIERALIPPTVRYDDQGNSALFAIVISRGHVAEYERRVADLRA
jgi:hypothetical protein